MCVEVFEGGFFLVLILSKRVGVVLIKCLDLFLDFEKVCDRKILKEL